MKTLKIPQLILLTPALLLSALTLACAGAAGPAGGGGGGGGAGGNAVGENPSSVTEVGFNPGSIQAGGEGEAQGARPSEFTAKVQTKDGRGNCGVALEAFQEIFPGEGTKPILMSWASGNETGPFGAAATASMGNFGRVAFPKCPHPACPLLVSIETPQFRTVTGGRFLKLVSTYTDPDGKFFQSEPKILPYHPECSEPPCEVCLPLKEESEIAEQDRVRGEATSPGDFTLPTLPPPPENTIVGPPGLRFNDTVIDLPDFTGNLDIQRK